MDSGRATTILDIIHGASTEMRTWSIEDHGESIRAFELADQLTTVHGWLEAEFFPPSGWLCPLDGDVTITQLYGHDPDYPGNDQHFHYGLDFAAPVGTPILAVAAGTVVVAGENQPVGRSYAGDGYWGTYVEIEHADNSRSGYCHLSQVRVAVGDIVEAGQLIGLSGNTGYTTGPHLHLQRVEGDTRVDPTPFLNL